MALKKASKETTSKPNQTRESPQGKASRETKRGRSEERETMENNRYSRLRKFHEELPSVWFAYSYDYFYVYDNWSYTDYKIIKKIPINETNSKLITEIERRINEDVNADSRTIAGWVESFRSRERLNNRNNGNVDRGRTAGTTYGLDGESRDRKFGDDSSKSNGNSEIIGKSSREIDLIDYINENGDGEITAKNKPLTNREILAGALESAVKSEKELEKLQEYRYHKKD